MTAIVARRARAPLPLTIVVKTSGFVTDLGATSDRRNVVSQDYSLFDHLDHGRAASSYSCSRSARRADLYRKALYVLAIFCL